VFDKGFSNFYKGTAFVVTDAYKKSNVYTFSVSNDVGTTENHQLSLYKGISHGQLAYKTDRMIMTPYANAFGDDGEEESTPLFESACRLQRRFDYEKKISVNRERDDDVSENKQYNHLLHDSLFEESVQSKKMLAFIEKCHLLTVKKPKLSKNERLNDAKTKSENMYYEKWCDFNAFIDPKYVQHGGVLDALYDVLKKIVASSPSMGDRDGFTERFDVDVGVDDFYMDHQFDRISNDLGVWCLFFHFKKSIQ
jgi:hypothetical protein